jgi:hypothetical protein
VAAGEEQLQAFVGNCRVVEHLILRRQRDVELPGLLGEGAVAADPIDRSVPRGGREPGARVVRGAVARPALGGDRERLLSGFLGELEVAEVADQVCENAPPLVAEDPVEDR